MTISNLYRQSMTPWRQEKAANDVAKGMEYTIDAAAGDGLEKVLMQTIAATLEHHYPPPKGLPFWWAVEVNGSVTYIFNLALSGQYAYVLHTKNCSVERVVKAGGEILERYGVPRESKHYSADRIIQLHADNPTRFLKHHA